MDYLFVQSNFPYTTVKNLSLRWRHNGHDCVSNHQLRHCLLNRLFERRSKKTSKLRVTGLCDSLHKWPVTRKMFPFDDVIMDVFKYTSNLQETQVTSLINTRVYIFKSCLWQVSAGYYRSLHNMTDTWLETKKFTVTITASISSRTHPNQCYIWTSTIITCRYACDDKKPLYFRREKKSLI